MPETVKEQQAVEQESKLPSPFGGGAWSENIPEVKTEQVVEEKKETTPVQEAFVPEKKQETEEEILDPKDWLKRELEVDDIAILKAEREELKKLKESQSQVKYETLPEDKEEEFYNYYSVKKQLEKAESANIENAKEAADLIRTYYKFKYKDFNEAEVAEHFEDQYTKPEKPVQTDDMTDDEYELKVNGWKTRCEAIDRKIIRDAKVIKPEFSEFKSKVVRPELPKYEPQVQQQSQESLAKIEEARKNFLNKLDSEYSKFEGYKTQVKDESVELPVTFKAPDEAKAAIRDRFKNGFDLNEFIDKRWSDESGSQKVEQIMSDIYVLENLDKILSGIANNAANDRLQAYIKSIKKTDVGVKTSQETYQPTGNGQAGVSPFGKSAWSEKLPVSN